MTSYQSDMTFDVAIIGAGPAGYVAAIRAAQLGLKTALIEKEHIGGICLNWGCIPTKALLKGADIAHQLKLAPHFGFQVENINFNIEPLVKHSRQVSAQLVQGIHHLLKKNNVQVFEAGAYFKEKGKLELTEKSGAQYILCAPHIIVATGASASHLPHITIDKQYIWTYKEALQPKTLPKSLLVIGSGAIGSEFACLYQSLGTKVTLVDIATQILPQEDMSVSDYMKKQFERSGMQVEVNTRVNSAEIVDNQVACELVQGNKQYIENFERVLVAIGIRPNTQYLGLDELGIELDSKGFIKTDKWGKTNVVGVYAVGDVAGIPCLAHKASHEAICCVEKIAGVNQVHPIKKDCIPACTYTIPQVASIGLTEKIAKDQGFTIHIGQFPFQANGKALAQGSSEGFIKTITDASTGEILGVHMVGHEVTELIQGISIAKTLEATDESLTDVIFPHPTLSEAIHESVLSSLNRAIHI